MEFFDRLKTYLHDERLIAVATVIAVPASATIDLGAKLLIHPNGQTEGDFPAGALRETITRDAVRDQYRGESQRYSYTSSLAGGVPDETIDVFIEVYAPSPHLIMFGGDHIAIPLMHYAKELGFRVTVIDARSRFANRERFPEADEILVAWPDKAFAQLQIDPSCYIAILSHDPKLDEPATRGALATNARYIGAIGSHKTHIDRRARLEREGFTPEQVDRIHGPIGLDLGGKTPPEIALAIIAEIVATRYDRHLVRATTPQPNNEVKATLEAIEETIEVAGE